MLRTIVVSIVAILLAGAVFAQLPNYVAAHHFEYEGHGFLVEYNAGGFTETEVPLVVMLHGGGGTSDGYNMNTRMYQILQNDEAIILFPQGDVQGMTWVPSDRVWIWDIVLHLQDLMDIHFTGHSIDWDRVYVVGSSYGGWLAHAMAYLDNDHYAAVATVSGGWPGNQFDTDYYGPPDNRVGALMIHNKWDQIININQASKQAFLQWSEWNGADDYSKVFHWPYYIEHTMEDNGFEWVKLYELRTKIWGSNNHTWPHYDQYGIEPVDVIWPFFQQFDRGELASEDGGDVMRPTTSELAMSAYPNPFNAMATIALELPAAADVRVAVYDVLGREVARLADGPYAAGSHQLSFDATNLPSGVYLVQTVAGGESATQKLILAK